MGLTRLCGGIVFVAATTLSSAYAIHKSMGAGKTLALLFLGASVSAIVSFLVFPMALTPDATQADPIPGFFPLPLTLVFALVKTRDPSIAARILLPSAALFAPIGLLLPTLEPSDTSIARRAVRCLAIPLAIEACRLLECLCVGSFYKTVSTDSILLAAIAIGAGYMCNRLIWLAYNMLRTIRRRAVLGGQGQRGDQS